jgi:hypothetical protein
VGAELERDFVDVSFELSRERYIGEVKVTNNLPLSHAFRGWAARAVPHHQPELSRNHRPAAFPPGRDAKG